MANERLRTAMARARVSIAELAVYTERDAKTVGRWLGGRVPHPRTRFQIAKRLREDEDFLWPGANGTTADRSDGDSDAIKVYQSRSDVPVHLWDRLLGQAKREIDILVYVGMFLTEKPNLLSDLQARCSEGVTVRILLGDRNGDAIQQRSEDEGIGRATIPAKIDHALAFFSQLTDTSSAEIHLHDTVLYNSIYRFDDEMIVNPHIFGVTAPHAPAFHVRRNTSPRMFDAYARSFAKVWERSHAIDAR